MMRSLFSGVSGLKAHQTRMDVIGNNIANVNTTAYKSKSMNFSDMIYQTTQAATGPNAESNTAGTNPRQIGLGVKTAAISTSITTEGGSQSTGNPFDLKLTGEAFFVVTDGTSTYFTRDGALDVDSDGNLCMSSTGYKVMGWTNRDAESGAIIQGTVSPINVMAEQTVNAAATTSVTIAGILDKFDDNLDTENGRQINIQTYDDRGYEYNLKFGIKPVKSAATSTKNTNNTERLYNIPDIIKYEDISELKFFTANGDEITAAGMPSKLLQALNEAAMANPAPAGGYVTGTHTAGVQDSVTVTINDAFLTANGLTLDEDLGSLSSLYNSPITVNFSGALGYVAYSQNTSVTPATETKIGQVKISDAVVQAMYGLTGTPTAGTSYTKQTTAAAGLLVTEKTFSDGSDPQYVFEGVQAGAAGAAATRTPYTFAYTDIAPLLAMDTSPKVQAQFTTTEDITMDQKIEGQFTIELLGMTDANGNEVNISNLGQTDFALEYNTGNGDFVSVGGAGNDSFTLNLSALGTNFKDVSFNMGTTKNVDNGEKSTIAGLRDDGYKAGIMTGVSIGTDGVITVKYSNGISVNIAQIAVATFANAMGLENSGDNLYSTTANSGDPSYVDIKASGTGYMTSGVLEMSNVDLSQEFTTMITTQRGFQANSRTITVSDTLLEELINLKR